MRKLSRRAGGVLLGVLVLLVVAACAVAPVGQSDSQVLSPSLLGPMFDSLAVPAVEPAPAIAVNEMRGLSLSHSADQLTSQQLYDLFYMGVGGCDRHHDLYLQEDLGAASGAATGN